MRVTSFLLISSAVIASTIFVAGYAEDVSAGASELAVFLKPSQTSYVATVEQFYDLAPGVQVFNAEGDKIGTITAVSSHNGIAKTVWTFTDTYSVDFLTMENGKAVYSPEQDIALRGGMSSDALPY